ncbi:hypothetical protein [Chitinophaga tropicalis]|uniref:Uncharacterized protein n=1 Tax=Chitinophaga tropicalis TaxID=2683588 RepID=A0A7K1U2L4_9BACT|nr:hypothetical protein [Chitinophaga tropicalis]MVT08599.1 hypothetical protein [Chitinophaga tropicalis]
MKKLLIAVAAICLSFTTGADNEYCNARFQYCVKYPAGFTGQGESANGDGQTFLSADKEARMAAWGRLVVEEKETIQSQYNLYTTGLQITYKVIKPTWLIISGKDREGNIVYMKIVKKTIDYLDSGKKDTEVFQGLTIHYPPSQQAKYKDYCAYIAKSLQ